MKALLVGRRKMGIEDWLGFPPGFFKILLILIASVIGPRPGYAHPCGSIPPELEVSKSGYVEVPLDYHFPKTSEKIKLYWEKFSATKSPSKGAVFFLAGGPVPHHVFNGKSAPYFISDLFPEYDFYMFDYRGFSCSAPTQSPKA